MSYPYSLVKTASTGDILAASDYNNEHTNHITNNIPSSIASASANSSAMQTTVSPGGIGSESLATDLLGEIQRLRYVVNRIIGKGTQWYDVPDIDLHTVQAGMPPGAVVDFAMVAAPSGWLACDGSAVSRSSYAALFTAVGTTWGSGDGSTTFNLPASARKTRVGSGGASTGTLGNTVGSTGGAESATTTGHTHTANNHTHPMPHKHTTPIGDTGAIPVIAFDANWAQSDESISMSFYQIGITTSSGTRNFLKTKTTDTANTSTQSDTGMSTNTDTVSTIQPSAVYLTCIKT